MPDSPRTPDPRFFRTSPLRPAASPPAKNGGAGRPPAPPRNNAPGSGASSSLEALKALRQKALDAQVVAPPAKAPVQTPTRTTRARTASKPARRPSPEALAKRREKAESRAQLIERLNNPLLTLQETSLLLNVCPATVRRWANAGQLPHVRTEGNQRRFRWRDVQLLMPDSVARRR